MNEFDQWYRDYARGAEAENASATEDPPVSGFWQKTKHAVVQGAAKGLNSVSDSFYALDKAVGTYKIGRDDEEEKQWLDWYSKRSYGLRDVRFRTSSERSEGAYGFVETATQFATGMLLGKKVLGLGSAAAGVFTDLAAFDPHEERLSNALMQSSNTEIGKSVWGLLAAKKDDGELESRAKAALEGYLTGKTTELLLGSIRAKRAAKAGVNPETIIKEAEERAAKVSEAVTVEHTPGEPSKIRLNAPVVSEADLAGAARPDTGDGLATVLEVDDPARAELIGASINDAASAAQRPRVVNDEIVGRFRRALTRIMHQPDDFDRIAKEEGIRDNFARNLSPEEHLEVINALVEGSGVTREDMQRMLEGTLAGDGKRVKRHSQMLRARLLLGTSTEAEAMERAASFAGSMDKAPSWAIAMRLHMNGLASEVSRLGKMLTLDPENPVTASEFTKAFDSMYQVGQHLAGVRSNSGRLLDSFNQPVSKQLPGKGATETAAEMIRSKAPGEQLSKGGVRVEGGANADFWSRTRDLGIAPSEAYSKKELLALARGIEMADGDPSNILAVMRSNVILTNAGDKLAPSLMDRVLAYRANAMLSGGRTQATNFFGNLATTFLHPAENILGGALTLDRKLMRDGLDTWVGMASTMRDSLSFAGRALLDNRSILDPDHLTLESASHLGDDQYGVKRFLGGVINTPSRLLIGMDELFKQMHYRGSVTAQSLRLSREAGEKLGLKGDALKSFMAERMGDDLDLAFDINGGAVNPLALQKARYSTFTESLGEDTFGGKLQDMANTIPLVRVIFPFVRTPVNVFRQTVQRMPVIGAFQRQMREDLAAGGARRAIALGRQASGTMMYSGAAWLAANGQITGGGPKDPGLRKEWLDAGNSPYSVKLGGKWVEYRRLEPVGSALSIVADAFQSAAELEDADAEELFDGLGAAMASAVSSKTFLIGMTQFFDAVASGDDHKFARWKEDLASSFIPAALRQADPDDVWRESRGFLEGLQSKVPGMSDELEPRRNLFGERVMKPAGQFQRAFNPFTVQWKPVDDTLMELMELGKSIGMPRDTRGNIDLADRTQWKNVDPKRANQSPYDRMLELASDSDGGRNLREDMEDLVRSDWWKEAGSGGDLFQGGERLRRANRIVETHYRRAERRMLEEYPDLAEALRQQDRERRYQMRASASDLLNAAQ